MTMLYMYLNDDGTAKISGQKLFETTDVPATMRPYFKLAPMRPFGCPDGSVDSVRARTSS